MTGVTQRSRCVLRENGSSGIHLELAGAVPADAPIFHAVVDHNGGDPPWFPFPEIAAALARRVGITDPDGFRSLLQSCGIAKVPSSVLSVYLAGGTVFPEYEMMPDERIFRFKEMGNAILSVIARLTQQNPLVVYIERCESATETTCSIVKRIMDGIDAPITVIGAFNPARRGTHAAEELISAARTLGLVERDAGHSSLIGAERVKTVTRFGEGLNPSERVTLYRLLCAPEETKNSGLACFNEVMRSTDPESAASRMRFLLTLAWAARNAGEPDGAMIYGNSALSLAREMDDGTAAAAYRALALAEYASGGYEESARFARLAVRQARSGGDRRELLKSLLVLFAVQEGLRTAYYSYRTIYGEFIEELCELADEYGDEECRAFIYTDRFFLYTYLRESNWTSQEPAALCRMGIALAESSGNVFRQALGWYSLGILLQNGPDNASPEVVRRTEAAYTRSYRLALLMGDESELARICNGAGYFHFTHDAFNLACRYFNRAGAHARESGNYTELCGALFNLARCDLYELRFEAAVSRLDEMLRLKSFIRIEEFPFHSERIIYSIQGIALIKSGNQARAVENMVRVKNIGSGHLRQVTCGEQEILAALIHSARGEQEEAERHFQASISWHRQYLPSEVHFARYWFYEYGSFLQTMGRTSESRQIFEEGYSISAESRREGYFRSLFRSLLEGSPVHPARRAVRLNEFGLESAFARVRSESRINELKKKMAEMNFLYGLQGILSRAENVTDLLSEAMKYIEYNFLTRALFAFLLGEQKRDDVEMVYSSGTGEIQDGLDIARYAGSAEEQHSEPGDQKREPVFYCPLTDRRGVVGGIVCVLWEESAKDGSDDFRVLSIAARQINAALQRILLYEELLNGMRRLIESEKMASLGGLIAGVGHEINTPVGNAITASSFLADEVRRIRASFIEGALKKDDLDGFLDASAEACDIISSNLNRASSLVNSFKKIAADRSSEDARTFAVGSYTDELLTSMRPVLKNFRQRVVLNCAADFEIRSYPGSYSQVMNNLIMNALVHGYGRDDAGTVSISIRRERDMAVITVSDDGCGMDEETMKKIFLPFYTTRRAEGMSGLGLNAVYNTVTGRLGGSIRCRSIPGEGTEFTMEIPLSI